MNPRNASHAAKELLKSVEPPRLGPGPRPGVRSQQELDVQLESVFHESPLPEGSCDLVRALVLLWHDHLDAAHRIAQEIENPDGSFVHAIMHRREPDYWNSKYWWRRVGKHPCFPELAQRVAELLKSRGAGDRAVKLLPRGEWDPFAFVDACEAVSGLPNSDKQVALMREVQRIETEVILECLLQASNDRHQR